MRFSDLLRSKIDEQRANTLRAIGNGLPDYASYRDLVGYLRALDDIEKLCRETEKDME